ncbi:nuclear transport factor 2 family protein [Desulfovibrio desulfuricans]|uniref:Nuclear transport factor 2 family protein n=1 Tax=Desulfovibrio desulfuricans TaxID=876 RepID=A0A4P7UH55_DESDE|nr:nuclear transport factor 2 family protein [Desulfovibrio desulfuricans]QCC85533.1 nuclear transport factor 2 family protein [Desulfovibrio desulfuricans]
MNATMPEAVKIFMDATNTGNVVGLDAFLAADAILLDAPENSEIRGARAIKSSLKESRDKFALVVSVSDVKCADNHVILSTMASGNFPGSPLAFTYDFTMNGVMIQHLTVDLA